MTHTGIRMMNLPGFEFFAFGRAKEVSDIIKEEILRKDRK